MARPKPSPIRRAFGEQIRRLRAERGLSQEALADLAGLHRTYVGGIERGERNISLENIARLGSALNIPLHKIFKELSASDVP
jgi:transcriptional regulator with XRE-family HTH domain